MDPETVKADEVIVVNDGSTIDAYFAIRSDDQLENRFEPLTLPLWHDDVEFASQLASITSTLPLHIKYAGADSFYS